MKSTGAVIGFCSGEQTMAYYGEYEADYSLIMDYIIVPYDEFIITNRQYHYIENGKLVFRR